MCTETATFDINNATKIHKKIIDLGPFNGLWVGISFFRESRAEEVGANRAPKMTIKILVFERS